VTVHQVRAAWLDMFAEPLGVLTDIQARQIADAVNQS